MSSRHSSSRGEELDSPSAGQLGTDEGALSIEDGAAVKKDRFGFHISDDFHKVKLVTPEVHAARVAKEQERTKKWLQMRAQWKKHFQIIAVTSEAETTRETLAVVAVGTDDGGGELSEVDQLMRQSITTFPTDFISHTTPDGFRFRISRLLKRRVRKGIPDALRPFAWPAFVDADRIARVYPNPEQNVDVSVLSSTVLEEIERDVDRTYPRHVMFSEDNGPGQCSLRRVLRWYAALDPQVSYCQGMGFVAALFLTYLPEHTAFHVLYAVLTRAQCPLRLLYLPKLIEMQKMLFVLDALGAKLLPRLWNHLRTEGIHPTMFFTEWVMAFFCRGFSFELVTRVWDVFLLEGRMKVVYRVSLALLSAVEPELLELRFDKILGVLRDLPARTDAEEVMDRAFELPLKTKHIVAAETLYWQGRTAGRGV